MALALRFSDPLASPLVPARPSHLTAVPAAQPVLRPAGKPTVRPVPDGAAVRVLHPPVDPGPAAPLRLTRRGVVVMSLLVGIASAALVALAALAGRPAAGHDGGPATRSPSVLTVHLGDTLWSIATRVAPDADPRAEVAELQRINHLPSPQLVPGQRLRVR